MRFVTDRFTYELVTPWAAGYEKQCASHVAYPRRLFTHLLIYTFNLTQLYGLL